MKTTATKILAMVLALSMVFALCACGQNSATESSMVIHADGTVDLTVRPGKVVSRKLP